MITHSARLLACTLLLAGCALPRDGALVAAPSFSSAEVAPASVTLASAPLAMRAPSLRAQAPIPDHDAFACADGARLQLTYSRARDVVRVSVDGAPGRNLRREGDVFQHEGMALHRNGPRLVLTSAGGSAYVRPGDTLGLIALRHYGDRRFAARIAAANADQVSDPNLIYPGQTLRLPAAARRCRIVTQDYAERHRVTPTSDFSMGRRAFSAPSANQPELRNVRATATDRGR